MKRSYKVAREGRMGGQWLGGFVTTRRGRSVLAGGAIGQIVGRVYAPSA